MISDKKLKKIERILGVEVISDMAALDVKELEAKIVGAESAIKQAEEELEANEQYQVIKEGLKALSQSMKEVRAFQKAAIDLSLHLLEEKGK